ncbi:RHS repeat domain-containing protein [Bradyrhizobium sp. USDA 4353]
MRNVIKGGYIAATLVGLVASGPGWAASTVTQTSSFAYDADTGLVTQQVVEPDTPAFRLQTDYSYDNFGNVLTTTVSGADIVTRGSVSSYDTRGQFATSNSNALGQSESVQYDARSGSPTSQTGPNGLTTSWSYDGFGRKILEIRPDGTQTKWAYQFCSGVNGGTATCPTGAIYQVQETPYAADGTTVDGPFVIVHYDVLDREIARDSQGFDGSTIRATTSYDALGRVAQTSRPYFVNGGTPVYTAFTYDVLGRALSKTKPDGSVSQVAYHGLSVTKTNALGQTRSVTRDSQGKVVSVTDALNQTMTFGYDAAGNLVRTTDPVGNVVTASYDVRGNKVASSDPDLGTWSYAYNTLGLLVSQTDAKGQTVTQSYDNLDRMVQSVEPDMTSIWIYDTAAHGVGKLASTVITAGPGNGYSRTVSYDALGRPVQVATTIDGAIYTMGASYDANGLLSTVSYPSGFTARYGHTALGDTNQLLDNTTGQSYWTVNTLDAELRITQDTAGNGLTTTRSFDALTGRLVGIATGGGAVQNFSYTYDRRGNPLSRSDANTNLNETFTYDALSRLTSSTVNLTPTPLSKTFTYDPIGNLLTKSDVGTYSYPAAGSTKPHAVMSVSGASISTTFTYDANGNQTSGLGRSLVYTSYNKPSSITQGTRTISFLDDTDHQRFKQVTPEATTLYIAAFGVTAEVSNPGTLTQKWTDYLSVGGTSVGIRVTQASMATPSTRYLHKDHLGSVAVITNENGVVQERLSYDAWGKRRLANGADDPAGSITSQTTRGFTGEEQLSVAGLVHLNGRVYDPILARMTSADPTVPYATSSQGWNRYSYARNRPVRSVDPSGFGDYDYLGVSDIDESGLPAWNGYSIMPLYGLSSSTSSGGYSSSASGSSWSFGYTPLPSPTIFPSVDVSPFQAQVAADNAVNAARQAQVLADMDAYNQQLKQKFEGFAIGNNLQQAQKAQVIQVGNNGGPRSGKGPDPFSAVGDFMSRCLEECGGINYFTGSNGLRRGIAGLLELCGVGCEEGTQASIGDLPGEAMVGILGAMAATRVGAGSIRGGRFYRGARVGEAPSFVPRPQDFQVDRQTGLVKEGYGLSVFNNAESLRSKGFIPYEVDQSSIPDSLRIIQRGRDPNHFEIVPQVGAKLTPEQYIQACSSIVCIK